MNTNLSQANKILLEAYNKGYRVSDCGNTVTYKNKNRKYRFRNNRFKSYYRFNIWYEGKAYEVLVHKLQAYQKFKEKMFEHKLIVRHLDDNSLNNSIDNIELGDYYDNYQDRIKNGKQQKFMGI